MKTFIPPRVRATSDCVLTRGRWYSFVQNREGIISRAAKLGFGLMGIMFLVSAIMKLVEYDSFVEQLDGYLLVPEKWLSAIAIAVSSTELLLAVGLWVPRWQRHSMKLAMALLVVFALALTASLANQLEIDCGCFGSLAGAGNISWVLVARNLALTVIGALALAATSKPARDRSLRAACGLAWSWRWRALAGAAITGMLMFSMLLIQKNQILTDRLDSAAAELSGGIQIGEVMQGFRATLLGKVPEQVDFSKVDKTWLLMFSPDCSHCQRIMPVWNEMAAEFIASGDTSTRVLGVSIRREVSPEFIRQHDVRFPVCVPTSTRRFIKAFKVTSVPRAVLFDSQGSVLMVLK